mgnify:CR=1 FL=1
MISKNLYLYFQNLKPFNLTYLIILISLLNQIYSNNIDPFKFRSLISFGNIIKMKIKGGESEHTFIYNDYINTVQSLYVNNEEKSYVANKIYLEDEINEIKIEMKIRNINSLNKFFCDCQNITEIDLSNFNPVVYGKYGMTEMFQNCISLVSINFDNFDTSNVENMQNMFNNCRNLKYLNICNFDTSNVYNMYAMFSGCINLVYLNLSNFNIGETTSIKEMFKNCSSLKLLDLSSFDKFNDNYQIFTGTPNDMIIVLKKQNQNLINKFIDNCGNNWIFNQSEFDMITQEVIYISCDGIKDYINLTMLKEYIFNNKEINLQTTFEANIEAIINELIRTNSNSDNNIQTILNTNTKINSDIYKINNNSENINITQINETIKQILEGNITSLLANIDHENFFKKIDNKKYLISTLSNQEQNLSFIDLGDCETKLKNKNDNITEELIIYKIETIYDGIKIPIIEYDIYLKNGTKLNLDICKNNNSITYFLPVSIDSSEIFKYDPESSFYNDRCDKYTSGNGTDMTLYDRKIEYNICNLSLCEVNCTFKGYDINTSKVECDCKINTGINRLNSVINENDLINKLSTNKNILNMDVIQCTEVLTSSENIISNPGFFLLLFILVIFIIVFSIFCTKGYKALENKIEEVINKKFKEEINGNNKTNISNNIISANKNKRKLNYKKLNNSKKAKKFKGQNSSIKELKSKKKNNDLNQKEITNNNSKSNNEKTQQKLIESDYELNNASYEEAKKFDKRSRCQYYFSLLKNKQIFIFTFLNFDDYNSGVIRKFIFFLLFALHYTINALFFSDSNMHKIYIEQGKYDVNSQFIFILISAVLSTVLLRIILITLVLNDRNIIEIKNQPNLIHAKILKKSTLKNMKIKFGIFFVFNFILLVLFWYYLSCWNAIYKNTQIYLIKNTLISFAISMIYPFVIHIFPLIYRKHSLETKRKWLYYVTKIIQLL